MVDSRTKHQTHFNLTLPPFGVQFSRIHVSGSTKSNWWDWSRCLFTFDGYFWMKWIIWALNHFVGDESKKKQSNQTYTLIVKHSFFSTQFRMEQRPYSHFCVTHIANASPIDTQKHPLFFRLLFVVYSCTCDHMVLQKNSNYAACLVGSLGDTVEYSGLE